MDTLKTENDHLKTGSQLHLDGSGPTSSTSQPSGLASLLGPSKKQPMSLTKSFSLSLNDCKDAGKNLPSVPTSQPRRFSHPNFLLISDMSTVAVTSVSSNKDDVCAQVLVCVSDQPEVLPFSTIYMLHRRKGL